MFGRVSVVTQQKVCCWADRLVMFYLVRPSAISSFVGRWAAAHRARRLFGSPLLLCYLCSCCCCCCCVCGVSWACWKHMADATIHLVARKNFDMVALSQQMRWHLTIAPALAQVLLHLIGSIDVKVQLLQAEMWGQSKSSPSQLTITLLPIDPVWP